MRDTIFLFFGYNVQRRVVSGSVNGAMTLRRNVTSCTHYDIML